MNTFVPKLVSRLAQEKAKERLAETAENTVMAVQHLNYYTQPTLQSSYELPERLKTMARFAQAAYNHNETVEGHLRDQNLSTDEFGVYTKGNNVVFAVRGSKVPEDFYADDMQITGGITHNQVERAKDKLTEIEAKYPTHNIVGTGHSLGGATVSFLSRDRGILGYGYNPGSSPSYTQKDLKSRFGNDNFATIHQEGDFVSASTLQHAKNVWVLRRNNDNSTLEAHFMDNFVPHKTIEKIHAKLKETRNDAGTIARDLHNMQLDDDTLQAKHDEYTKAGGDIAINEGPLFGGGYHAEYKPKKFIDIDGYKVPAPGAQVFVRPNGGMYFFDKNDNFVPLVGTPRQQSIQLKSAKGYNEGPTMIVKDSNPQERVMMVAAMGGQGFDFVPVRNKEEYKYALGGLGLNGGLDAWSGKTSGRYIGNGAVDIFAEKPPSTADDTVGNIGASTGEFLVHNAVSILETAAEVAIDVASAGILAAPAELLFDAIDLADNVAGLATGKGGTSWMQSKVNELLPDQRHYNLSNTDFFDVTKHTVNSDTIDPEFMRDDRLGYAKKSLRPVYEQLRNKARQFGMSGKDEIEFHKFDPNNLTSLADAQAYDSRMLQLNEKLDALSTLQQLNSDAQQVGLSDVTSAAFKDARANIFNEAHHPREAVHTAEALKVALQAKTQERLANRQEDYIDTLEEQTGYNTAEAQTLLDTMANKEDFRQHWNQNEDFDTEYQRYLHDLWADFKHYEYKPHDEIERGVNATRKYHLQNRADITREQTQMSLDAAAATGVYKPGRNTNTTNKNASQDFEVSKKVD